jgi:hypothetical protein
MDLPYVANGKLVTGKFHYFKKDSSPNGSDYPKTNLEFMNVPLTGTYVDRVLLANNSFRGALNTVRVY